MDRRFLTVLGACLLFALVVSAVFYQAVAGGGRAKPQKPKLRPVVVAARALPVGIVVKPADLKIVQLAPELAPGDGFTKIGEVTERAVVSSVLPDEPIREARLAMRGAGVGLAPIIPTGMRAVAVRVNDVVGVAGFVLPGMRVDVLLTGRPPKSDNTFTKTVLQDILVLAAGQTIEPDVRGKAINTPVVTLLVSPSQAEVVTLAGEGRVQLVLRNTGDRSVDATPGREIVELYGRPVVARVIAPRVRPAPPPVLAPSPPPVKTSEEIVVIRGTQRSVEQVAIREPKS
ncbi:MAG TPA: Flp pilus assembly protein CpaB [Bryobacteraceae bacterium]|nr:Flp pilus assembly protein CpaB [Bryobacteraceae bacterium]